MPENKVEDAKRSHMRLDIYGSAVKNQEIFRKTDLMDYGLGDLGFIWETDPAKRKQSGKKILPAFSSKANKSKENLMHMYMDLFMTRMRDLGNTAQGLKMNDVCARIRFPLLLRTRR
jgi:hypothetical protein